MRAVPAPGTVRSSYPDDDVTLLLTDVTGMLEETELGDRERRMQGGGHYSEMLPIEYRPSAEYQQVFLSLLAQTSEQVARLVAITAERVLLRRGSRIVTVSLARAGTPFGVLLTRYWRHCGLEVPHYGVSIIRGKGLDEVAIAHVRQHHPDLAVQFVDGWTGKGAIQAELDRACGRLAGDARLDPTLAVIADPGHVTNLFGTRQDVLLPSACLNATVSGLVSRTVYRPDLTGDGFHGAKYYPELADEDVSNLFVDTVERHFPDRADVRSDAALLEDEVLPPPWTGRSDVAQLAARLGIEDLNLIKPGAGETLRVLLRRLPWKILIRPDAAGLEPILLLARERCVPVEVYEDMSYGCCGVIRPVDQADA